MRRRRVLTGLAAGAFTMGLARAGHPPFRQDIADLTLAQVATLEAAIGEMQRRSRTDPGDPAGWLAHTAAHATACARGPQQVHGTWWFLPWHRAFLAMTERKLQAISGDATLRLPYWNWTTDRAIPAPFARPGSPLSNARRFTPRRLLRGAEVDCPAGRPRVAALDATSFQANTLAGIPAAFGGAPDPGPAGWHGRSRLEGVPHAAIHNFVGGEALDGSLGDMTELSTAAIDPLFYAHHANLDRLWQAWRSDPARRATEPQGTDFTGRQFVFTWLDGLPVAITLADLLDAGTLGYDHLTAARPGAVSPLDGAGPSIIVASQTLIPPTLRRRERASLTITGLIPADRPMNVEVMIAPENRPGAAKSVGCIALGRRHGPPSFPDTVWTGDITQALQRVEAPRVTVTAIALPLGEHSVPPALPYTAMWIAPADGLPSPRSHGLIER